jgi:hypothetical protein
MPSVYVEMTRGSEPYFPVLISILVSQDQVMLQQQATLKPQWLKVTKLCLLLYYIIIACWLGAC